MTIQDILAAARGAGASDIHVSVGLPTALRVDGALGPAPFSLTPAEAEALIRGLVPPLLLADFEAGRDVDFAFAAPGGRQRVNVFRQQGALAATIRLLNGRIPTLGELGLPEVLLRLADRPAGLVLVTGPTGSGKSTTLAAAIQHVNQSRPAHILTIEDPVEYVYPAGQALIHQRELGRDTPSFAAALRSALREDPDVILVGEMRDYETISAAVTAAETGHLVFSTLHTMSAAQTIDRIIDACPGSIQGQIRAQLAMTLQGVITQRLLPLQGGQGRCAATEVLMGTDAVRSLIRENKAHQLGAALQSGAQAGMHTMNADLARLVRLGRITPETARANSLDRADLDQYLS